MTNAYSNLQFLSVFKSGCFQVFLPDDFDHCILQLLLECKVLPRGIKLIDQLLSPARVYKKKINKVLHFLFSCINEILIQKLKTASLFFFLFAKNVAKMM